MAAVDTPLDLVKQFLANFERKQRNLAKRKSKLDGYREKLAKGETLNEEQRKAVDGYDGVLQSINLVQEFITHSKELADSVERAVKHEESQLAILHERHTLSFLHTHVCLMRLLNALDANPVRLAVAKASSENHLKLLDVIRALVTAPIIETWPGTSAAALSDAQTFLQQHPALDAVAEHLNNFVTGRSTPVPLPNDYDGPHKKFTFKDARLLCFRLLATPAVQRSMGLPSRPASIVSSVQEDNSEEPTEHETEETARACSPTVTPTKPVQLTPNRVEMVPTAPQPGTPEVPIPAIPTIGILDQVIKPLGGTFNFLQASKVAAPDPLLVLQPPVHEEVPHIPPMTNGISDSHPHYDPHLTSQMEPPHAGECYTTMNQSEPAGNYSLPMEPHLELVPSQEEQGLHEDEEVVGVPNEEDTPLPASVSSKPVSYADLVRRQSYSRPSAPNTTVVNEVRKREPHKTVESNETESTEVTHNGFHAPHSGNQGARGSYPRGGGAARGRGDFRGGRGGPNRGGFGGAQRRGVGGNRGGRYESGSGRGGAPYRGMSAGVAQPIY